MIVSGAHSQVLGSALADALGVAVAPVEYERFPDGEFKVRVPDLEGDRAVVVASTTSSDAHVEVLQLQDAAAEAGVDDIVTVVPYLGYGRQDRAFAPGEPVSARAMARAISAGADRVLTVAPHEESVRSFFDPTAVAVDVAGRLATTLPRELSDPVFLAPDEGGLELAETVSEVHGGGAVDCFEKTRHSGSSVSIAPGEVDVGGRDVVVVDDIVATGTTMAEAVAHLRTAGAEAVHVRCVHPVFVNAAYSRLQAAGVTSVAATDTVEHPVSAVSVAPAVAEHL